jgi:RNA polymerase sigma factor (sigma-70 family)
MKIKLSEQALITAMKDRTRVGAEALYDMYSSNLFKVIYSIVKHQEIAEDTLQQTMLKIWSSINQYNLQKGKLYTWMITIARNMSKDALRSKAYHNESANSDLTRITSEVDERYHTTININHFGIRAFVDRLKKEHREILDLIYYQGYTHVEVADELQIPLGTVKTRWLGGINTLKKMVVDR